MFCGPIPHHKVFGSLGFRFCRQLFGCLDVKRSTTQWCNCHGGFLASAYAKDEVAEQKIYMFVTPKFVKLPSQIWRINPITSMWRLYTVFTYTNYIFTTKHQLNLDKKVHTWILWEIPNMTGRLEIVSFCHFRCFFFLGFLPPKKGQKLLEILNLRFLGGPPYRSWKK